jgi:hypothetical protein
MPLFLANQTFGSSVSLATPAITGTTMSIRGVSYAWPTAQGGASTVLTNDGSGTLTWAAGGGGGGITNPNPILQGKTQFQTSGGTNTAYIDGTTGNYVNNRADGSSTFVGVLAAPNAPVGAQFNVFVGYQSGQNVSGGSNMTAVGIRSLNAATTGGGDSTAIGYYALGKTTGASNTALGSLAGYDNLSGTNNTYLGYQAGGGQGGANQTYSSSTALGTGARITASNQIVLGTATESVVVPGSVVSVRGVSYTWPAAHAAGALANNGSGTLTWAAYVANPNPVLKGTTTFLDSSGSTQYAHVDGSNGNFVTDRAGGTSLFLGVNAGGAVTTATVNTALGASALRSATTGDYNVAVGRQALDAVATGGSNTAVGYQAGLSLAGTSNSNTLVGSGTLGSATSASGCTAIGTGAGYNNGAGMQNTYLGQNAATDGGGPYTRGVAIGYGAALAASNQVMLGTATETTSIPGLLAVTGAATFGTIPTSPTATAGDASTKLATTRFLFDALRVFVRSLCQGRLTLVSGIPLGDGSGTTLYFTPYKGNTIGFDDGTVLTFAETSLAVPATSGVYDVFAFNNAGTLALETSAVWAASGDGSGADGTRTNAISSTSTSGILYKASDATRRYLGTFSSTSGTCYDVPGGIGTQGRRNLWNYYNRTRKPVITIESASSWIISSSALRAANGNANNLSSFKVVCGVSEDLIEVVSSANFQGGTLSSAAVPLTRYSFSVGYDSTTAVASGQTWIGQYYFFCTQMYQLYSRTENIGLHTYWYLEYSPDSQPITVYANGQGSDVHGLHWC